MRATDYEILYDLPAGEYDGRNVDGVRTVTWRAGRSLEVICHPTNPLPPAARREARERRTRPAVQKINDRNRERHMMRLIEENFPESEHPWVITGTYAYPVEDYGQANLEQLTEAYEKRGLPWEMRRVRKDIRNFFRRIERRVRKLTGMSASIKWIERTEEGKQPPVYGLPPKYHFHAVITAPGLSRDEVEAMWEHGRMRIEALDLANDGAARLARYLNKQKTGGRWWSHSRNLKIPTPTVSDRRISRRRLAMIAADVQRDGVRILEKLYPGYKVVELPDVKYSDFVPGCYIYARMRRRD